MISANRLHVAYIEDEPLLRELFFHQFKHLFASIDLYAEPRNALKLLHQKPAELLFCDVWMPEISGVEVYQEFRKSFPQTPFIFVSGDLNLSEKLKGQALSYKRYARIVSNAWNNSQRLISHVSIGIHESQL